MSLNSLILTCDTSLFYQKLASTWTNPKQFQYIGSLTMAIFENGFRHTVRHYSCIWERHSAKHGRWAVAKRRKSRLWQLYRSLTTTWIAIKTRTVWPVSTITTKTWKTMSTRRAGTAIPTVMKTTQKERVQFYLMMWIKNTWSQESSEYHGVPGAGRCETIDLNLLTVAESNRLRSQYKKIKEALLCVASPCTYIWIVVAERNATV